MSKKINLSPLALGAAALSLIVSLFFFWMWYEFYLRIDFNEMGRYFDPATDVVYTDDSFVLGILAFVFLIFAGVALTWGLRGKGKRF